MRADSRVRDGRTRTSDAAAAARVGRQRPRPASRRRAEPPHRRGRRDWMRRGRGLCQAARRDPLTGNGLSSPALLRPARSSTSTDSPWPLLSKRMAASPTPDGRWTDSLTRSRRCARCLPRRTSSCFWWKLRRRARPHRGSHCFAGRDDFPRHRRQAGKPTAFAPSTRGRRAFSDAGQPDVVSLERIRAARAVLRAVARLPPLLDRTLRIPLGKPIVSQAGRLQFTVKLEAGLALLRSRGLATSRPVRRTAIRIPADQSGVEEGEEVEVTLF